MSPRLRTTTYLTLQNRFLTVASISHPSKAYTTFSLWLSSHPSTCQSLIDRWTMHFSRASIPLSLWPPHSIPTALFIIPMGFFSYPDYPYSPAQQNRSIPESTRSSMFCIGIRISSSITFHVVHFNWLIPLESNDASFSSYKIHDRAASYFAPPITEQQEKKNGAKIILFPGRFSGSWCRLLPSVIPLFQSSVVRRPRLPWCSS